MTKIADASVWPLTREPWTEFAPMVGRIVRLQPTTPVRLIQGAGGRRTAMARLPSGALVDRTIALRDPDSAVGPEFSRPAEPVDEPVDVTALAGELATWLGLSRLGLSGLGLSRFGLSGFGLSGLGLSGLGESGLGLGGLAADGLGVNELAVNELAADEPARDGIAVNEPAMNGRVPERADAAWRGGRPPAGPWKRVETVPGEVVRDLVRQGARAHLDAADQGLGARAADALLDLVVLTVTSATATATVTNRSLSALSSMGFLPAGGNVVVSVNRGWTRVAAEFGSAYAEPARPGLDLL